MTTRSTRTMVRPRPTASPKKKNRGSAILLAVALLVLLAVMGIAFISTARSERLVSAGAAQGAQIDLLLRGTLGLVEATLVNDVLERSDGGGLTLRPATADGKDYEDGNLTDQEKHDAGLRYRHWDVATGEGGDRFLAERVPARAGDGAVVWPAISSPVVPGSGEFEDPTRPAGANTYADRVDLAPTTIAYAGKDWPALQVGSGATARRYLAADTDADGIADAGLFPLNVRNDGITYYAAVRIVDNNSALNASVAWRRHDQPDPKEHKPGTSFFPTHVDLASLLAPGEIQNLERHRFAALSRDALRGLDPAAAWMRHARLVHHPDAVPGSAAYRMLPASDALALAQDPLGLMPGASAFLQALLPVTMAGRPRQPYAPDDVNRWYEENYNFDGPAVSRRPLLVASNPVTNAVPTRTVPTRLAKLFGVPELVSAAPTNINTASFELLWHAYWNMMSGHMEEKTPFDIAKEIRDLGRDNAGDLAAKAAEQPTLNPYSQNNPQRMFRSPIREFRYADGADPNTYSQTLRMPPFEVLLLRGALAAVNAIDLRDQDEDITSKRITLKAKVNGTDQNVNITVFGNERQPFITEIYAHTNTQDQGPTGQRNPHGYVAVELHNPFDQPLSLRHYRLGIVGRSATSPGARLRMRELAAFDEAVTIPANGYLVVENYSDSGAGAAAYRPVSSGLPATGKITGPRSATGEPTLATAYVQNLHEVLADAARDAGELVLLRPRRADGPSAADGYDEVARLEDWVPLDQYDFTGIELQRADQPDDYEIWQYSRPSGDGERAWKFVYPGRYDGSKADTRHEGTFCQRVVDITGEPTVHLANLGRPSDNVRYDNRFPGVQLAQQPSPKTQTYPAGGFTRVADALAAPFIGAYVVADSGAAAAAGVLEMNAITSDAAFADDLDDRTDRYEHLGRFAPIPRIAASGGPKTPQPRIHWRPERSVGHGAEVRFENFYIANIVDNDAVQIQGYDDRAKSGNWYAPGHVILRNFEVGHTERSAQGKAEKLHVDHIQITLGQEHQEIKTDVTIEDGYIHSGNADTLLIQDGKYGTIRIRNLKVGPGLASVKITIEKGGSIDRIIIEDSPGLSVAVTGVKGTEAQGGNIGPVEVRNSPGAQVKAQRNWQTGARLKLDVTYDDDSTTTAPAALAVDDYSANPALWRYGWSTDFFDNFTTLPTAADELATDATGSNPSAGSDGVATEPAAPTAVEGLININTTPWPVLAALPLVEPLPGESATDSVAVADRAKRTRELAQAIVAYRQNVPFKTVRELNLVDGFQTAGLAGTSTAPYLDPAAYAGDPPGEDWRTRLEAWKASQGDLSPAGGIAEDYEQQHMMLGRISNLVTTRSDSFTCYITLQGWRNAAHQGGLPELVLERRELYILDRSTVTPANPRLKIMSSRLP